MLVLNRINDISQNVYAIIKSQAHSLQLYAVETSGNVSILIYALKNSFALFYS